MLDEELNQLPAKYREPLVLRYLFGQSNKEVASQLGLPLGVVEGRLKRGKDRLRLRLVRRGMSLTMALTALGSAPSALEAAAADSLVAATAKAALAFRYGTKADGSFSENAARLAHKELAMSTSTMTTSGVATALVVAALILGLPGDSARPPADGPDDVAALAASPAVPPAAPSEVPVELAAAEDPAQTDASNPPEEAGQDSPAGPPTAHDQRPAAASSAVDLKSWSPAEKRILATLEEPAQIELIDTPLSDVLGYLRDYHDIMVHLDGRSLDDVGISADTPITLSLKGIPLRSALRLMLWEIDLTYIVKDDVLLITTPERAEQEMETRVYSLQRLGDIDPQELAEVIRGTICRDALRASDPLGPSGPADAEPQIAPSGPAIGTLPGCLVVTHNQRTHEQVADFLGQLESLPNPSKVAGVGRR